MNFQSIPSSATVSNELAEGEISIGVSEGVFTFSVYLRVLT